MQFSNISPDERPLVREGWSEELAVLRSRLALKRGLRVLGGYRLGGDKGEGLKSVCGGSASADLSRG